MSQVYNPEADTIERIERLEIDARETRRHIAQTRNAEDKRVLKRQLKELEDQVEFLKQRLP